MPSLCDGSGKYPTLVSEEYVQLDGRGRVLARLNELAADQLGHNHKRLFGQCRTCRGDGYEITDDGTVAIHHCFSVSIQ